MILFNLQYKLDDSPTPSDEEAESSDDEDDAFGPKKEKVEEDPVKSTFTFRDGNRVSSFKSFVFD